MSRAEQAQEILTRLDPEYAHLTTGLTFSSPFQLLVATILSAQCTDERVNMVTPSLFARFPTPNDFAEADREEVETLIHSCGFYRNKAKNIQAASRVLVEECEGRVPNSMEELLRLPGVARKTANVVLAHAFDRHEGIAVDTHVQRLSHRLGLTDEKTPERIEVDLMNLLPVSHWGRISDVLIWHGRRVCAARSPSCSRCLLADICPSAHRNPGQTTPVSRDLGGPHA